MYIMCIVRNEQTEATRERTRCGPKRREGGERPSYVKVIESMLMQFKEF